MNLYSDGGPAFPAAPSTDDFGGAHPNNGMTLLDYFAAQALPPAITYFPASIKWIWHWIRGKSYVGSNVIPYEAAKKAYDVAEAMLAERARRKPPVFAAKAPDA